MTEEEKLALIIASHEPTDYAGQWAGWGCTGCRDAKGNYAHFESYHAFASHVAQAIASNPS